MHMATDIRVACFVSFIYSGVGFAKEQINFVAHFLKYIEPKSCKIVKWAVIQEEITIIVIK